MASSWRPSVRLSVCLSFHLTHSAAFRKRCKLESRTLHGELPQEPQSFYDGIPCRDDSPRTRASNRYTHQKARQAQKKLQADRDWLFIITSTFDEFSGVGGINTDGFERP